MVGVLSILVALSAAAMALPTPPDTLVVRGTCDGAGCVAAAAAAGVACASTLKTTGRDLKGDIGCAVTIYQEFPHLVQCAPCLNQLQEAIKKWIKNHKTKPKSCTKKRDPEPCGPYGSCDPSASVSTGNPSTSGSDSGSSSSSSSSSDCSGSDSYDYYDYYAPYEYQYADESGLFSYDGFGGSPGPGASPSPGTSPGQSNSHSTSGTGGGGGDGSGNLPQ